MTSHHCCIPTSEQNILGGSAKVPLSSFKLAQSCCSSAASTSPSMSKTQIIGTAFPRVKPTDLDRLPSHLRAECDRLKTLQRNGTALTEFICRPLVQSTCIWLLYMGVIDKVHHPDVLNKVSPITCPSTPLLLVACLLLFYMHAPQPKNYDLHPRRLLLFLARRLVPFCMSSSQ